MASITSSLRQNFLAGLLVLLPFGLTAFILYKLGKWIIALVSAAPAKFLKPLQDLPHYAFQLTTFSIGLFATLLIVLIIGTIARNFIGRKLVTFGENMISRIPLARTVYIATKQIMETLFFATGMKNLKRVAMFEYPRKGIHSIGFITATLEPGEHHNNTGESLYSIFVPTAPNPTSGYYIMLPQQDVKELDISVEDAFRLIVSAGLATSKIEDNE
ncbi:MAG: DUF502 domain-containing protein [Thermodesulfobacteriota bacterium]